MQIARFSPLLAALACGPTTAEDPSAVAGEWSAPAVQEGLFDTLSLDDDGVGTAKIFRRTSALFAQDYDVVAAERTAQEYDLDFACPPSDVPTLCENWAFTAYCERVADDALECLAPSWYHADRIDFVRD